MNAPFVFIVGCGRSGTTMLRSMLDSHPEVAIPRESYFIDTMRRRRDGYVGATGFDVERFLDDLLPDVRFRRWELDPEMVADAVRAAEPADLGAACRAVYDVFAREQGATRPFDKTPMYALCVPELHQLFPDARFVHLVRDGRDVAASYAETDFGPRGLAAAASYWRRVIRAVDAASAVVGPEQLRTFRYEDLAADPAGTLQAISAFVELDYDERMLDFATHMKTRPRRQPAATKQKLAGPAAAGVRNWTQMAPADVRLVESVAGAELRGAGYALSDYPVSAVQRRAARARAVSAGAVHRAELGLRRTRMFNRLRPAKGVWAGA
ncbi:MAG: sulfotransferase [Acidimicrobiales bacterium]|nr:sulfotransferase [Acidimicrobiales bacterium]